MNIYQSLPGKIAGGLGRYALFVLMAVIAQCIYAQGPTVSIQVQDMKIENIILKLRKEQPSYKFLFNHEEIKKAGTKTLDLKNVTINEAMKSILANSGLTYSIEKNVVVIKPAAAPKSEPIQITGHVTDSDGEPLTGVAVKILSTNRGCSTDLDGNFTLKVPDEHSVIMVSMIGMEPHEFQVGKKRSFDIVLRENSSQIEEVVVTGYTIVDKRASTSAITSIKAEDVLRPDAISIDQMLEGKIPDLISISTSGESGVAPKIRIRGTSSIIGNREPLWVVDGIIVNDPVPVSADDLNDPDYINRIGNAIAGLNPQDIERLDVLKDASATALYGTQAANGVIVITTKRGKEGKPTIRYNNSFNIKLRPKYTDKSVDVMNSMERTQFSRELWDMGYVYTEGANMVGYEKAMTDYYNGLLTFDQLQTEIGRYETNNTDWFDLITHNSFTQSHTLSLSGGGERGSYYASLGITDDDDIVKGTSNKRYNAMLNLDVKFSNWLTAAFSLKGNVNDRKYYQSSINPVQYAYRANRVIPAFDSEGNYQYYKKNYGSGVNVDEVHMANYNILNELEHSWVDQSGSTVSFDANFRFRFTDWLTANAIFAFSQASTRINDYWGPETYQIAKIRGSEFGEDAPSTSLCPQGGELNHSDNTNRAWTARLQLDWNKYFNDDIHNFSGGIGVEANSSNYNGYQNTTRGYFHDRGMTFVDAIDIKQYPTYATWIAKNHPTMTNNKSNKLSGYLTVSYNYDRLVFFNINGRIDGSNNFGDQANKKLLPIWSVSASFDAKRLKALEDLTWLDYFSIKGSYGFQGNMLDSQSPVMIIRRGSYNSYLGKFTSSVVRNPNPDLKWEKTTSWNLGFEWGFLNRAIEVDADFYWKSTKDAFMTKTVSTVNGYDSYVVNGGDIDNYGYSAAITFHPIRNKNWNWTISTNFSRNINKIKTLPAGETYELNDFLNGNAIVKGKPVGTFYSYRFVGLSPIDGGPQFDDWGDHYEDLVGLSKYDTYTRVLVSSGTRDPFMQGGLSSNLRYKNLRASVSFTYSLGAKTRLFGMYGSGTSGAYSKMGKIKPDDNMSRDYLNRWKKPGDEKHTNIPAIISYFNYDAYKRYQGHWSSNMMDMGVNKIAENAWDMYDYSDLRVVSADYLKLQNVSVFYQIPDKWIQHYGIQRLEFNASASNVFTLCDPDLKGQTPNQGGFSTIQLSDRPGFSFGLNVSF